MTSVSLSAILETNEKNVLTCGITHMRDGEKSEFGHRTSGVVHLTRCGCAQTGTKLGHAKKRRGCGTKRINANLYQRVKQVAGEPRCIAQSVRAVALPMPAPRGHQGVQCSPRMIGQPEFRCGRSKKRIMSKSMIAHLKKMVTAVQPAEPEQAWSPAPDRVLPGRCSNLQIATSE